MSINQFSKTKSKPNDEWYTTRRNIQTTMELTITDQLKDKIIYLPADSDESEIYKYLVETKDKYQYKELIHTSDDFRTHEDLFEYCDIVLTNPPFSLTSELMEIIDKYDKDYFLYNHFTKYCSSKIYIKHFNEGKLKFIYTPYVREFKRPNNNIENIDARIYTTLVNKNMYFNKDLTLRKFSITKKFEDIKHEFDQNGYLNIDYTPNLPCDYDGIIVCSTSLLPFLESQGLIEILRPFEKYRSVVNGKNKFQRLPIKIKH